MATHDQNDDARWTDEQMARIAPSAEWEPDAIRGFARLQAARAAPRRISRHWIWLAAGAVVLFVSETSMVRAIAERCGTLVHRLIGADATRAYYVLGQRPPMPDF